MKNLGDFDPGALIYGKFTSYQPSTGACFALAGTPAVKVYKDDSTSASTSGITLTASFNSVTGLNHYTIDTSSDGTFYSAGSFFSVVITAGTIDSVSVVGAVVGCFTLRKTSGLKPATAGRTLVVDAAGLADANAVKIGPSGSGTAQTARDIGASVLLSAGTGTGQLDFSSGVVKANLVQILATALTETAGQIAGAFKKFFNVGSPTLTCLGIDQTGDSFARLGAPIGASISADIHAIPTSAAPSAATISAAVVDQTLSGHTTAGTVGAAMNAAAAAGDPWAVSLPGAYGAGTAGNIVGNNLDAAVSSRLATSGYTAPPSAATISAAVVDQLLSGHTTTGSVGAALQAASSAGDPWATALPGAYGSGTAGNIVGNRLDAAVSTRLATSGYTGPPSAPTISAAVVDQLLSGHTTTGSVGAALAAAGSAGDPWAVSLPGAYGAGTAGAIVGTDVPAIKAKTDNLPASPAAVSDVPTADANADALLDRTNGVETSKTLRQSLRLMLAVLAGKVSGAGTTTVTIRDTNDTKNRVVATVDSAGDRSAITYDVS